MGWPETGRFKGRPPSLFQEAHLEHVRLEILLLLAKRGKGYSVSLTALARELGRDVETMRKVLPKVVGSAVDGVAQVFYRGREIIIAHGYREGGDPMFCDHGYDGYLIQCDPNEVVRCPGCGRIYKNPPITIDWLKTPTYFEVLINEEVEIPLQVCWDFSEKTSCIFELGETRWFYDFWGKCSTVVTLKIRAPGYLTTLPLKLRVFYLKNGAKEPACLLPVELNVCKIRCRCGNVLNKAEAKDGFLRCGKCGKVFDAYYGKEATSATLYISGRVFRRCENCSSYAEVEEHTTLSSCPSCGYLICGCGKAINDEDKPVYIKCRCGVEYFRKPFCPIHRCQLQSGNLTWRCDQCNKEYSPFELYRGVKGIAVCGRCSRMFKLAPEIQMHGLAEQKCPFCGHHHTFNLQTILLYGIIPIGPYEVKCDKCGRLNKFVLTEQGVQDVVNVGHVMVECGNEQCLDGFIIWWRHQIRLCFSDLLKQISSFLGASIGVCEVTSEAA